MMLTTMILATLLAMEPPAAGTWRLMKQSPDWVVAVEERDDLPRPGAPGPIYVLTTFARPQESRAGSYRQGWVELYVTCPDGDRRGHYGVVWDRMAMEGQPLPEVPEPMSPPIAMRSFSGDPFLGPLALDICNDGYRGKPVVEGSWDTVLQVLRHRSESPESRS